MVPTLPPLWRFFFSAFNKVAAAASADDGVSLVGDDGYSSPAPALALRRTPKGRVVISRHSMETAFAAVCKAYVPRPGQPMSRTREEVTALAQVGVRPK